MVHAARPRPTASGRRSPRPERGAPRRTPTPRARAAPLDALGGAGAVAFRALHSTGWEQMAQPVFDAERSDMAYAGPDGPARTVVEAAIADALARLWIHLVFARGWNRRLGLRLLTDTETPA